MGFLGLFSTQHILGKKAFFLPDLYFFNIRRTVSVHDMSFCVIGFLLRQNSN